MTSIHVEVDAAGQHLIVLASGADAELARLAKILETLTPLFTSTGDKWGIPGALCCPLTWPAVVQLQAVYGPFFTPGPHLQSWITDQIARRTGPEPVGYRPPPSITPFAWQLDGAAMIAACNGALITDEPGTGKTGTAILGAVEWTMRQGVDALLPGGPILVVCPASVVDSWVAAWQTWAPHYSVAAWRGSNRNRLIGEGAPDVLVSSYETALRDAGPTSERVAKRTLTHRVRPSFLIVDECHYLKNPDAKRSLATRRLAKIADAVVLLSGTPITHTPADLWPSLEALIPGAWPAGTRWIGRYCWAAPAIGDAPPEILGLNPYTEPEFRLTILGQDRRIAKADVLPWLPEKTYDVLTCELPAQWRRVYDDFEERMLAELPNGDELSVLAVLTKLTHLSSLASGPCDVQVTYGPDVDEQTGLPKEHVHLELLDGSWKVDTLLEFLESRPGEPVVVAAPSRPLVEQAGRRAAEKLGRRVGYVVGEQGHKARTRDVEAFQAGELDLMCVTTSAGGVGITLTAARTLVFLRRPWSLVESLQMEDRCHRIGSEIHDSIEIVDVIARNTVDSRVRSVLRERAGQLSDLVQDPRIVASLLGGRDTPTERKTA